MTDDQFKIAYRQMNNEIEEYLSTLLTDSEFIVKVQNNVMIQGYHIHYLQDQISIYNDFKSLDYTNKDYYREYIKTMSDYGLRVETNVDRFKEFRYRVDSHKGIEAKGVLNSPPRRLETITFSQQSTIYKYLDKYHAYKYNRRYN